MINNYKKIAILESIKYLKENIVLGIGTGSTMTYFIKELEKSYIKNKLNFVVPSSLDTEKKLKKINIISKDLSSVDYIDIYIDSIDEIDKDMNIIKGKGGALTKEKIMSYMSKKFICIFNMNKNVDMLGNKNFLPIEIIPSSIKYVCKKIYDINGKCVLRNNFFTDNGNNILDVYNLNFENPKYLEVYLNSIPGIVENGIFSHRTPDLLISYSDNDIKFKVNNY